MRRLVVTFLAFVAAALLSAGIASAQICVNVDACNDYFFGISATTAPDVYALTGFEYGCSQSRLRLASGVIRIVGNRLDIEFTGTNRQFDFTQTVAWHGVVTSPGLTGDYKVLYTYLSGGALTAHGAAGPVTVTVCAEPARPSVKEADTSEPGGATP